MTIGDERPGGAGPPSPLDRFLEGSRFVVVIGATTAIVLAVASFAWSIVKAFAFVGLLFDGSRAEDAALVKLFQAVDVILIGTVMLILGLGLWELFVKDLDLPPALTTSSFDDLKAKIATTLVLVLVVQFLERFVQQARADDVLELGAAATLVGGLLVVYARWRP